MLHKLCLNQKYVYKMNFPKTVKEVKGQAYQRAENRECKTEQVRCSKAS